MFALYVRSIPPREPKTHTLSDLTAESSQDFVKVSTADGKEASPLVKEAPDEARDAILEKEKEDEEETMEL